MQISTNCPKSSFMVHVPVGEAAVVVGVVGDDVTVTGSIGVVVGVGAKGPVLATFPTLPAVELAAAAKAEGATGGGVLA